MTTKKTVTVDAELWRELADFVRLVESELSTKAWPREKMREAYIIEDAARALMAKLGGEEG